MPFIIGFLRIKPKQFPLQLITSFLEKVLVVPIFSPLFVTKTPNKEGHCKILNLYLQDTVASFFNS